MDTPNKIHPAMQRLYAEAIGRGLIDGEHRQAELARLLNTTSQRVKNWESRGPSKEVRLQIQDLFGIDALLSEKPSKQANTLHAPNVYPAADRKGLVPVISWVQAGDWSHAADLLQPGEGLEWVETGVSVQAHTFALRVDGDSMEPEFSSGSVIVVEPDMEAYPGDYVIAKNGDNEATFKQLVRDGADYYLKPLNPRYPIKPLAGARIIGVVREQVKRYR
jgi:SOS-response transcriptional repressor LexA